MQLNSALMNIEVAEVVETHEANIVFETLCSCHAVIKVFDENEYEVRLLLNETISTGKHQTIFNYGNLKTGSYKIKLILNTPQLIEIESIILNIK